MSLLDACATNGDIFLDVHNFRPILITDELLSNYSAFGDTVQSMNFDAACSVGKPPPNDPLVVASAVILSVPLTCPPVLKWLGQLRANSSYFNLSSSARLFEDADTNSDVEFDPLSFLSKLHEGDLGERAALFSELFIKKGAIAFNISAEQHYALCAPAVCSYTTIEPPTTLKVINSALSNYGGTASSIIMLLGSAVLYLSFIFYQFKRQRVKRLVRVARSTQDIERSTANPLSVSVRSF